MICSLGLLGVITRVHFGLVDELYFDVTMKIVHLDEVLADLDATSAKYDFWRVNWMQKSDKALLWAATAVPPAASKPDGDYPEERSEQVLDFVFAAMDEIADTGPLLNPVLEGIYNLLALTYDEARFTGPLRNMLPVDRRAPLRVAMAEWSFRPQDLQRVLGECEEYFERGRLAEHPDRDRADQGRRRADVGLELGRRPLHRQVQLDVPDRGLPLARREGGRSTPTCAASGSTCSAKASPSRPTGARSTSSTPSSSARTTTSTGSGR